MGDSPARIQTWHDDPDATLVTPAAHAADQLRRGQPFLAFAGAFILGIALSAAWPRIPAGLWLVVALPPMVVAGVLVRRGWSHAVLRWGLLAVVPIAAGWSAATALHVPGRANSITRYLSDTPGLAKVTGTVVSEPRLRSPERGAFGQFNYAPPRTLFTLKLDAIMRGRERTAVSGKLLVRIDAADHRVQQGQRIAAAGWMARLESPRNPGEPNYRRLLAEEGVHGRLSLASRGNWQLLAPGGWRAAGRHPFATLRRAIAHQAQAALRLGMLGSAGVPTDVGEPEDSTASEELRMAVQREQHRRVALLEALLLGRWTVEVSELRDSFRQVGLAHLMAISGAHLSILLGLIWMIVRFIVPHPPRAALVVLVVLLLYLLAVPLRVPIVRAGIMAGLICAGYATGRQISAIGLLALAAMIVLLWRPMDLFDPGFQLSFGVVAALLMFAQPVSHWLWPPPTVAVQHASLARQVSRYAVDYLAVSIVAYLVALPLVAYHFAMVNPLAVLLSVLALPVVTALLGLGYLKILLGLLLPSVSILVAGPLAWVTDTMLSLVEHAGRWPGTMIELTRPPPLAWVIVVLMVVVALLGGGFARRRWALLVCAAVIAVWTLANERPGAVAAWVGRDEQPALRINMFSVGGGSCYLVRAGEQTFMFDCGSQAYLDVGERSIVPALRRLGVRRIDALFLSHADLDHYCGALAVIDAVAVDEVRLPPQLLREAERAPDRAVGFLMRQLRERGVRIKPTSRGWSQRINGVQLKTLWPPADFQAERANDTSLVLSVRHAGRRLLLSGDIDEAAMTGLLDREGGAGDALKAHVVDLPHHGSFNPRSSAWLAAVSPRIVLQSSGPRSGRDDEWAPLLRSRGIERLITDELGMVELSLPRNAETVRWHAFRKPDTHVTRWPKR